MGGNEEHMFGSLQSTPISRSPPPPPVAARASSLVIQEVTQEIEYAALGPLPTDSTEQARRFDSRSSSVIEETEYADLAHQAAPAAASDSLNVSAQDRVDELRREIARLEAVASPGHPAVRGINNNRAGTQTEI
jgi:hypothetical protein